MVFSQKKRFSFTKSRMYRLFGPDERTLIVAMDHSVFGNAPGLEDPGRVIAQVLEGGADVIMTTLGTARYFAPLIGQKALILTVDGWCGPAEEIVEEALRLGVDGIKYLAYPFGETSQEDWITLRQLANACDRWNLPLLAEMIPKGFGQPETRDPEWIARAARMGAEAGADFLKVPYAGPPSAFQKVIERCYLPVTVLGGPRVEEDLEVLQRVEEALSVGAAGVAMGRNLWGHPSPAQMTLAVKRVLHDGWTAEEAYQLLKGK